MTTNPWLRWPALSFIAWTSLAHAADDELLRVPTRDGVEVPVVIDEPDAEARAVVLLFPGGGGQLELTESGVGKSADNFTVRTRQLFAAAGMVAVVVDAPSDHDESLSTYRASAAAAKDVSSLVAWANSRWGAPVWLVATSRGTISAANAAVRGVDVQGVVLTSSVTAGETERVTLRDLALDRITAPVLLVHHKKDACPASPLAGSRDVEDLLENASDVSRKLVDGGTAATGSVCSPESAHGFFGLDADVLQTIAQFIRAH